MFKQFQQIHHDCTMYEKCFYFLLTSSFSGKMVFLGKLKLIYHSIPRHQNNCSALTFLILFKKIVSTSPIQKREQRLRILYEILQRSDNKVISILYQRFLIYRTVKSKLLKKISKKVNRMKYSLQTRKYVKKTVKKHVA